ncbi:hypothetical protein [Candidatus Uabimicrobium amorphum]|uniref:Uncharacterized protein n=1 Tax=Uabimicrobium amorphum TaxID=2596890 RepID=A0A5S9F3M8_UABAM|nr:hypothetical protein [Candidatus Uabimicrobium amorphum]BBM84662.1 hypothetical protein UABAM_03023 [Candidatus Uabimicrobium amorphum]
MKKIRIEFYPEFKMSPLSFWVHKNLDGEAWIYATKFEPELPPPVPGKGYPMLIVSVLGMEIFFSSVEEIEHFLDVFQQKNMPTSLKLSKLRSENSGPNQHWLSRFPSHLKSWSKRQKIIPVVQQGLQKFKDLYN